MKSGLYRIICPRCKAEVLENNEKFNPTVKPNGAMFRKVEGKTVRSPHDSCAHVRGQNFQCPMCRMPVCTPQGYLRLRDVKTGEVVVSKDAKEYKVKTKPKKKAEPKKEPKAAPKVKQAKKRRKRLEA